ncbi:MAG: glycosyltransferase [Actinomycetota bacterium]
MLSVIICTYNRSESLIGLLNSLLKNQCDFDYEVLVVDNNSKDKTKEVIFSYMPRFNGRLRYLQETRQGLSFARNTGAIESRGEILAFTDDDCVVDALWLKNIQETMDNFNAECVFGKILPMWSDLPPDWMKENSNYFYGKLGALDYGDKILRVISEEKEFFGGNLAIRKEALLNLGLFNVALGRKGASMCAGEDTDLFERMIKKNKIIIYNPLIFVYHRIDKNRMTKKYFRKISFGSGVSYAFILSAGKKNKSHNLPSWYIKKSFKIILSYLLSTLAFNKAKSFRLELEVINCWGVYVGYFKSKLTKKSLLQDTEHK